MHDVNKIHYQFQRVGHGGIFLQFGVAPQKATCEISPFHIYEREITIQGSVIFSGISTKILY